MGALPDMVTFTPDGQRVLVANEGEPEGYCDGQVDPVGSISVVDLSGGVADARVRTAGFDAFDGRADELRAAGVRLFGPGATVSQDLEPEYVATSADGRTAWVTLQEANSVAVVDLQAARVTKIVPLGLKDHSAEGQGIDASDKDDAIAIDSHPVKGMYMPDGAVAYSAGDGSLPNGLWDEVLEAMASMEKATWSEWVSKIAAEIDAAQTRHYHVGEHDVNSAAILLQLGERLVGVGPQDVERQPLRAALPDPGQAAELRDEPLDGRGLHRGS